MGQKIATSALIPCAWCGQSLTVAQVLNPYAARSHTRLQRSANSDEVLFAEGYAFCNDRCIASFFGARAAAEAAEENLESVRPRGMADEDILGED